MNLRRILYLVIVLAAVAVCAFAADIAGKWTSDVETPMGTIKYTYQFEVDGETLTGTAANEMGSTEISEGKVSGDEISFVEKLNFGGQEIRIDYKGKIAGDEIKCTRSVADFDTSEIVLKRAQ